MHDSDKPKYTYFYNASAMALGGRITRPFDAIIETQAASVLPIDGGMGTSRVENFRFKEIASFKSAYSVVTGSQSEEDGSFATLTSVTIEDLNILEVVRAKRIICRIASRQPIPEIPADGSLRPSPEPQIVALGSTFEGLSIGGCDLRVELNSDFACTWDRYQIFKEKSKLPELKGMIVCSLVKDIVKASEPACAGLSIDKNTITVPHFGKIHLAQFLCAPCTRRLVMLRVELGCSTEGSIDGGCGSGGGTTYP